MTLAEIYPENKQITVIDFAPVAVAYGVKHFPYITGIVDSVESLPFPDNTFNVLLAMDITEHLPVLIYAKFLPETSRVLEPGGRAVFLPGMTRRQEHINTLSPWQIMQHCRLAGFSKGTTNETWTIVEK